MTLILKIMIAFLALANSQDVGKTAGISSSTAALPALPSTAASQARSATQYPWPFVTTTKNGITEVRISSNQSLILPNPKVDFNFESYNGFKTDVNVARLAYKDFFTKYFEAYEKEYLKISTVSAEYSPLNGVLATALERLKTAPIDDLAKALNPPLEFKSALDRNIVLFESSAFPKIIKEMNQNTTKLNQVNEKIEQVIKSNTHSNMSELSQLQKKHKELEWIVYAISGILMITLVFLAMIYKKIS